MYDPALDDLRKLIDSAADEAAGPADVAEALSLLAARSASLLREWLRDYRVARADALRWSPGREERAAWLTDDQIAALIWRLRGTDCAQGVSRETVRVLAGTKQQR